jgi:hypothetical protein
LGAVNKHEPMRNDKSQITEYLILYHLALCVSKVSALMFLGILQIVAEFIFIVLIATAYYNEKNVTGKLIFSLFSHYIYPHLYFDYDCLSLPKHTYAHKFTY